MTDLSSEIRQQVIDANQSATSLNIVGGNTKSWYGRTPEGSPLKLSDHTGIINYQPSELIITVRAGTKLSEIASVLDEHGQRLPFDPPYFGNTATIGGTVACGFSGPRRPYAGSCRDFVLGCTIVNGRGEMMRFGGEVMKNVAGFDVSRAICGSMGTLGVLLDISLKVLPHRIAEQTLTIEEDFSTSIQTMNQWASTPLPVTAMASDGERTYFRICGTPSAVENSRDQIGGEIFEEGLNLWKAIREHSLDFFDDSRPLYRLSLPQNAEHIQLGESRDSDWFIGWGGAQRWLKSRHPLHEIQKLAELSGGHASMFRNGDREHVFAPLSPALMQLHRQLKSAFDPNGTLNPGRMYREL